MSDTDNKEIDMKETAPESPAAKENKKENTKQNGKKAEKKSGKRKNGGPSGAFVALVIIVFLAVIGILGFLMRGRSNVSPPSNFVNLPTINGTLTSSSDGTTHEIDLDLTLEYAEGKEGSASNEDVYNKIKETVLSFDYEALKDQNSTEYIKDSIRKSLSDVMEPGDIANVYIGNIVIDFPGAISADNESQEQEKPNSLKRLFTNIK